MDKFGIFNVINSLAGLYGKLQNQSSNDSSSQQTPTPNAGNDKNVKTSGHVPLQHNMINTMVSHEAFVKRVLEKNGK